MSISAREVFDGGERRRHTFGEVVYDGGLTGKRRVLCLQEGIFQPYRYRKNPKRTLLSKKLECALAIDLLILLTMGARLRAQSAEELSSIQQGGPITDCRVACDLLNQSVGSSQDPSNVSSALGGAGPQTQGPAYTSSVAPSASGFHCQWPRSTPTTIRQSDDPQPSPLAGNTRRADSRQPSMAGLRVPELVDPNLSVYYKNKLEFSLEAGWLPINIPFPFDFLLGDAYHETGLNYTFVPIIASVRWHLGDVKGPPILRGNWDMTISLSATAIPRGPETRYFAYIMGIRRNFVPRRWRVVPYVDARAGLGLIDAKGPWGVRYAQGQDFTFTLNIGSGARYNLNSRFAISAGLNWMHISNLYLSQPKFLNYGINVYGPMAGIDVTMKRHRRDSE